jgi:hypothetical protein
MSLRQQMMNLGSVCQTASECSGVGRQGAGSSLCCTGRTSADHDFPRNECGTVRAPEAFRRIQGRQV